ncbi:rhodanese-like domain-containing protein [Coxiella endosymbiont of Amblyomma sculptum]|uniref:rhodanese-like domain-containing protein n=1 Tax=Coxiella endosymbiont of Amblyomma sculptum TaxID=2487929 RepID=UPI00132E7842|nr:rhodanese-like domain-containing protein [Coxiella endosymbiont of Amblyomma sculptum]QHG92288.1 rhodanese-like domain-containing protein [Coxiella endosymbiont of Amblyomma sculptum]
MEQFLQFSINHWILLTEFSVALIALCILDVYSNTKIRLTPSQAVWLINNEKAVVIDIRDSKSFEKGHITHAINISTLEDEKLKKINQYRQHSLIIVCATGYKSSRFVKKLHRQGFQKIHILSGGMDTWKHSHMPVVKQFCKRL